MQSVAALLMEPNMVQSYPPAVQQRINKINRSSPFITAQDARGIATAEADRWVQEILSTLRYHFDNIECEIRLAAKTGSTSIIYSGVPVSPERLHRDHSLICDQLLKLGYKCTWSTEGHLSISWRE